MKDVPPRGKRLEALLTVWVMVSVAIFSSTFLKSSHGKPIELNRDLSALDNTTRWIYNVTKQPNLDITRVASEKLRGRYRVFEDLYAAMLHFREPNQTLVITLQGHNNRFGADVFHQEEVWLQLRIEYEIVSPHMNCPDTIAADVKAHTSEAQCLADLYGVRENSSSSDLAISKCGPKEIVDTIDSNGKSYSIEGLLRNQVYRVKIVISSALVYTEKGYLYKCVPPGAPAAPPTADIASFSLGPTSLPQGNNNELSEKEELVTILWQPLPALLQSDPALTYVINCNGSVSNGDKPVEVSMDQGHNLVRKNTNTTMNCTLESKASHYGKSSHKTLIVVPAKQRRIDLGDQFRLFANVAARGQVELEWPPFKVHESTLSVELLSWNSNETVELPGFFTIYSCRQMEAGACTKLSGMERVSRFGANKHSHNLTLLPETSGASGLWWLGLSYVHNTTKNEYTAASSGIIWVPLNCGLVHDLKQQHTAALVVSATVESQSSLRIGWTFPGCPPGLSRIKEFEVEYSRVGYVAGCKGMWNATAVMYDASDIIKNSVVITRDSAGWGPYGGAIDSRRSNQTKIYPSSMYQIRVRARYNDGETSKWSEIQIAHTLPDPKVIQDCWMWLAILTTGATLLAAIGIIVFYVKVRVGWTHSKSLFTRYKRTKASVVNTMTVLSKSESEISLGYCANRAGSEPSSIILDSEYSTQTHSSSGVTHGAEGCQQGFVDETFEYIPRKYVEVRHHHHHHHHDDGPITETSCGDSAPGATKFEFSSYDQDGDDISIDSHSSFLNTLINEQNDLNNNNTN